MLKRVKKVNIGHKMSLFAEKLPFYGPKQGVLDKIRKFRTPTISPLIVLKTQDIFNPSHCDNMEKDRLIRINSPWASGTDHGDLIRGCFLFPIWTPTCPRLSKNQLFVLLLMYIFEINLRHSAVQVCPAPPLLMPVALFLIWTDSTVLLLKCFYIIALSKLETKDNWFLLISQVFKNSIMRTLSV